MVIGPMGRDPMKMESDVIGTSYMNDATLVELIDSIYEFNKRITIGHKPEHKLIDMDLIVRTIKTYASLPYNHPFWKEFDPINLVGVYRNIEKYVKEEWLENVPRG